MSESSASPRPARRYRRVKRLALAFLGAAFVLLLPLDALAEDQPFKTVVDGMVPRINGLTIQGGGLFTTFPVTLTKTVLAGNKPDQCFGC